jgi:hypothetical protein
VWKWNGKCQNGGERARGQAAAWDGWARQVGLGCSFVEKIIPFYLLEEPAWLRGTGN